MTIPVDHTPPRWMNAVAAFLAVTVCSTEVIITLAPYFGLHPLSTDPATQAQQQTIMQNVFIGVVGFFFGASVGTRAKDDAIKNLAAATSPSPGLRNETLP